MALYTRDSIERLRETVDMVQLVGAKTDLRRVGTRWVGLCPFHDERTPSFSVNAEEKLFYCFGCEAKGDSIGFVEQSEALDFRDAVEALADRLGVTLELEDEDPRAEQRRRRRERLLSLLERATRFYATYLWEADEARPARDYLAGRGLSEDVLREFRVGWAPGAWDRVTAAARRDGSSEEELLAAGLAQRARSGGLIDRFRGRVMFPLADARGRVLGFGARAMRDDQTPKYLNTSENDVYHKGRQLFGIDIARSHAAKAGRIVVVEGYTDVLALHQAGVPETVAIMGTALTEDQLAELGRAAPLVLLALDADRSGQEAMVRVARMAKGLQLRVVELPEGTDPADLVAREGAESFESRLERAMEVRLFQLGRVLADADLDTPSGRDQAIDEVRKLIDATSDRPALRDALIRRAADRLDVPVSYVAPVERASSTQQPVQRPVSSPGAASLAPERAFLVLCLASGETGREYLRRLTGGHLSSELFARACAHLVARFDDPLQELSPDEPRLGALVTGVALEAGERAPATELELHMTFLQLELRRLEREIRQAAEAGDRERQRELATTKWEIDREMRETV